MQQANYFNCACMVRYSLLWTPWSWRRRQRSARLLTMHVFLTPECGSCTYHRQKGVAEAESRLGGEVLVRDEADPDLTAFGSVASRYRLWAAPATQDGFLSQIFYFHIVVPGRQRKKTLIISLSETITRYWSTPLSWNCLCPRYTATLSSYGFVLVEFYLYRHVSYPENIWLNCPVWCQYLLH